jgi:hypothetical protein
MSVAKRLFSFFLMAFTGFVLLACTGKLEGYVFLDENGNNTRDDFENNLANLAFTVTKDDEEILDAQTDASGEYSVASEGSGTYCVSINDSDLSSTNDDGTTPSVIAATLIRDAAQPEAYLQSVRFATTTTEETVCDDSIDDDSDGDIDCDDSDCSEDTACVESICDDELDDDDDGDTDCDDSDCSADTACDTSSTDSETTTDSEPTVESGSACDDTRGGTLNLNIPIAKDYSTAVAALLADTSESVVSRSDIVTLSIQYPSSCEFDTGLYLSSSLTPMNVPTEAYDSLTGQLNLNTVVAEATSADLAISEPLSVADDAIGTYSLELCVGDVSGSSCVSDGSLDSRTVTVEPSVICPDDSVVTLKSHSIEIDSQNDVDVTQSMSGTQTYGATITVTTTITNNSSVDYEASQVELVLTSPSYTTSQSYDSSCSNLGQTANCTFDLDASGSVILTTSFVLPATLQDNTEFTMSAELTLTTNGSSTTFAGDDVVFSLVCNDCSS